MELYLALTSSASCKQVETAIYLLLKVPLNVLFTFSIEIIKPATERGHGTLDGVAFVLFSSSTYLSGATDFGFRT